MQQHLYTSILHTWQMKHVDPTLTDIQIFDNFRKSRVAAQDGGAMNQDGSKIERKGVEIIPRSEQTYGFWDLFVIWAGFSIIFTNFLLGSLGRGIGIIPAIVAHCIGILIIAAVAWLGTALGAAQGVAGTVAMRSAFGINGRHITSIVMFIVGVGWFGVQTGIAASAAYTIASDIAPGIAMSPRAWMVILGILMAVVVIFGYKAIVWLNRISIPALVILLGWLTYKIITVYGEDLASYHASGGISFLEVVNLLPSGMAAALILSADYGRYVKPGRATIGVPVSIVIFFGVIASLGVVSAAIAGDWDPVKILVRLGLGALGLILLILAAWTTNVTNIYVSSLALANITSWGRVTTSAIASVVGILLAIAGIYTTEGLQNYLSLITALLIPASGVLIVDYFIRNSRTMLTQELFKSKGSQYWYYKGWNIRAVIAWICGALYSWFIPDSFVPAFSAILVAGIVYYASTMRARWSLGVHRNG